MSEPYVIARSEYLWWRPASYGYTNNLLYAGIYGEEDARRICRALGKERHDEARPLSAELARVFKSQCIAGTVGEYLKVFNSIDELIRTVTPSIT